MDQHEYGLHVVEASAEANCRNLHAVVHLGPLMGRAQLQTLGRYTFSVQVQMPKSLRHSGMGGSDVVTVRATERL